MDRFDEMRARGINTNDADATASDILLNKTAYVAGQKITGTYEPSGGGGYNVFVQTSEPQSKDGVWIKETYTQEHIFFKNVETVADGTVAITLNSATNRNVIIQDDSQLSVSVDNTYLAKNNELDGNHVSFWGDGEKWNCIKNPTGETATVTFDLNGGTGEIASQTLLVGQKATVPPNPGKSGNYMFTNWYRGDEIFDISSRDITGDTTLVAHYEEYTPLEYIQSKGTAYIDTRVAYDDSQTTYENHVYEIEIEGRVPYLDDVHSTPVDASLIADSANSLNLVHSKTGKFYAYLRGATTVYTPSCYGKKFKVKINKNEIALTVDGVTTTTNVTSGTSPISTRNLFLFGTVQNARASYKLYRCKMWSYSGTLVRDFIPIKRANGDLCLFEQVEHKTYYSPNGTFFEPLQPTYVNYIESTGTQYINTRVGGSSNPCLIGGTIEMDLQYTGVITADRRELNGTYFRKSQYGAIACRGLVGIDYQNNEEYFALGITPDSVITAEEADNGRHTFYANWEGEYKIDNVLLGTHGKYTDNESYEQIYLFACQSYTQNGSSGILRIESYCNEKLYGCKIYTNGIIRRNFKPALDDDDVPCLYDEIANSYFYNAGTGTFLYGE